MSWNKKSGYTPANKDVLDKLSVDSNNNLLYNGSSISGGISDSSYNKYKTKYLYAFGDSITQGEGGTNYSYPYFVGQILGMNVVNKGSSGADSERFRNIVCGLNGFTVLNYTGATVVTMMIGHNGGVGTSTMNDISGISDFTQYPNTYYGNVCASIEYVLSQNANIRIFLLTPIQSLNSTYINSTAAATTALQEIGKKYALPVINLQHNSGLNFRNLAAFTTDNGTHPNGLGNQRIAEVVARQLLAY